MPRPASACRRPSDLEHPRDRAGLLVVVGRDALREPGRERERLAPGGEAQRAGDLHLAVALAVGGDVLRALEQAARALEAQLPQRQRQRHRNVTGPAAIASSDAGAREAQQESLAGQPDAERALVTPSFGRRPTRE